MVSGDELTAAASAFAASASAVAREAARKLARGASSFAGSASESAAAAAGGAAVVGWKLARSVGKAAWFAGTTFVVLGVPLMWALDREMQQIEAELSRQSILGATDAMLM